MLTLKQMFRQHFSPPPIQKALDAALAPLPNIDAPVMTIGTRQTLKL
jgi:hypothetical protein